MKETDKLLDHEYDGIKELDNPLPGWWLATFYGTIIFTVLYIGYYHVGNGPTHYDELKADLAYEQAKQPKAATGDGGPTEESLMAIFNDVANRNAGKTIYTEKCASCHGANGEGMIGPNLTDKFWIHGDGSLLAMHKVISEGVADKGMPPWKGLLKPQELTSVLAYAHSLKGTNPANAKAPQGNEVK